MKKKRRMPEFDHYIALASILGAGLSLFLYYRYSRETQAYVIFTTAIGYTVWGVLHHKLIHYLTIEIIFEYVLVAALGSLVVLSLVGY
ncbi:MAG: hypothetical protein A3A65_04810 [Candidatus Chisholmbacteria bacterium RIFCSPLOWO2_01_FULL_49_14]|uniref:Uncharacterized protein n=1 Tax=Candidatus Chisholmbacteria bacterium RIFCSPLOWO2_01_FULL_49_14 TaxID=1797593 RepID=A0A1G1W460_9BACT|nr:MAG: hypothetical protein A3A65_04810 [Candidatus Chisholmbacteria bacterium RIFCSPLOWO2_01_FULL_49_14]